MFLGAAQKMNLYARFYYEKEELSDDELYGDGEYSLFAPEHTDSSGNSKKTAVSKEQQVQTTQANANDAGEKVCENSEALTKSTTTAEEVEKKEEQVEKEEQVVEITLEGVEAEQYYSQDVEIKLRVQDEQYQQNKTTVKNNFTDADGMLKEMEFDFEQDGIIHDNSYVLQEEGEYQFVVRVENKKKVLKEETRHFHIDKTPPVIVLDTIENEPCYKLDVSEMKENCVKDTSPCQSDVYINGSKQENVIEEPGEYAVTILAQDEAGNVNQKSAYVRIEEQKENASEQTMDELLDTEENTEIDFSENTEKEKTDNVLSYKKAAVPSVAIICVIGGLWYQRERKNTKKWERDNDEIQ